MEEELRKIDDFFAQLTTEELEKKLENCGIKDLEEQYE